MGFKDDCTAAVRDIVESDFNARTGRVVPATEDIAQKDGAVWLHDAAFLYTDMADSSRMCLHFDTEVAARIIRAFLNASCRVIRDRGGEIRSFDGDRVMAIFLGPDSADVAVDTALRITWAVNEVVHEELLANSDYREKYYSTESWRVRHRTGIDRGTAFVTRAGVRGHNDLVSIGFPPNTAAKLSDYKGGGTTIITEDVYNNLRANNRYSDGKRMWKEPPTYPPLSRRFAPQVGRGATRDHGHGSNLDDPLCVT